MAGNFPESKISEGLRNKKNMPYIWIKLLLDNSRENHPQTKQNWIFRFLNGKNSSICTYWTGYIYGYRTYSSSLQRLDMLLTIAFLCKHISGCFVLLPELSKDCTGLSFHQTKLLDLRGMLERMCGLYELTSTFFATSNKPGHPLLL